MSKFAYRLDSNGYIKLLLHLRWLVLVIAIPLSIVIEILEGQTHDLQFLDEVVIDGLVLPISAWVVLTFVAGKIAQHLEREQLLEQQQLFLQRLNEYRDYRALTDFLVRFPVALLPVEQVSLFVDERQRGQLNLAAGWSVSNNSFVPPTRPQAIVPVCRICLMPETSAQHQNGTCSYVPPQASEDAGREYRILLIHNEVQVGIWRLHCSPDKNNDQIKFLTSLAPEIARALSLAIEDMLQAERAYREAQLYERRRITQELHDSLAQQVFYLHLSLDQLSEEVSPLMNEWVQHKVSSMRDVAADVYEQIRNNLSILRAWEQVNISEAISELARTTAHNADFQLDIDVQGEASWLSPHTCEHVYGIVRRALSNITRHARAQQVFLSLIWSADRLSIILIDDGVGFDAASLPATGHYGLALMREAIEALHGTMTLDSRPGNGTQLHVAIPLQPAESVPVPRKVIFEELQSTAVR
jgi:signal transduction histidine kinase